MIIQCEKCGTKYRLDDAKVGKKGVKVKCTKCQHLFVVKKEEPAVKPPAPPPVREEPPSKEESGFRFEEERPAGAPFGMGKGKVAGVEGEEWKREGTPEGTLEGTREAAFGFEEEEKPEEPASKKTPSEEEFDISFEEKVPEGKEGMPAGYGLEREEKPAPPATPAPEEEWGTEGFEEEKKGLKEETPHSPSRGVESGMEAEGGMGALDAAKGAGEKFPGEEEEAPAPSEEVRVSGKGYDVSTPIDSEIVEEAGSKPGKLKWLILVVLFVLLYGAAATLYISGALESMTRIFITPPAGLSEIKIESLNGVFADNEKAGRVFAVQGKIKNVSEEPRTIKVVRGIIYNRAGNPIATMETSPGRLVSDEELKTLPKEELLKRFKDISSGSVPARGTIPVMVVFTEAPEDIAEAALEVVQD
ncbi:MAG: zinc-ribbon domain-containing protein [Deltaproteobacteria bacterium]|nr:zinc-ribbon domain-containing protein [Deltaproteobacteria bacterium]